MIEDLPSRQRRICEYLRDNGVCTTNQIATGLNVGNSRSGIRMALGSLERYGIVERAGTIAYRSRTCQQWRLVDD